MQKSNVLQDYKKMKTMISYYIKQQKWEKALKTIFFASSFMYMMNQLYYDDDLEDQLHYIAASILKKPASKSRNSQKIIFYDSFGNVGRGLAYIYLKALCELKYDIEYITVANDALSRQVIAELLGEKGRIYTLDGIENSQKMKVLQQIIEQSEAKICFLHTMPDDVVGIGTFSLYDKILKRYMINMTDHAFWLGKNACDYVINFRQFGYLVCNQKREIQKEKLLYLPYYPQTDLMDQGDDIGTSAKQVIFSGGGIYKTYSKDKMYYRLVENILDRYENIIFSYCGNGYSKDMKRLKNKYPDRIRWERERTDFYSLMKQCTFYLSTYPYNGGLMTQYALRAGKIPVTFCDCGVDRELTIRDDDSFWNFYSIDETIKYIDKLLGSEEFRINQEKRLSDFLIDSDIFCKELENVLQTNCSKRRITKTEIKTDGTEHYPLELYEGMNYYRLFIRRGCSHMIRRFPIKYTLGALTYITNKMLGRY